MNWPATHSGLVKEAADAPDALREIRVTVVGASSLIAGCACDGAGPRAGGGAETAVAERTPHASETDPDGDGKKNF